MTYSAPPSEMMRFGYTSLRMQAEGAKRSAAGPALPIRVRRPDASPSSSASDMVLADGVLDTGATVSLVPPWSLRRLGIAADEGSRQSVLGAGGPFPAYAAKIGLEVGHCKGWLDIGIVGALVPDTKWSADPKYHFPLLLGRRGFFQVWHAHKRVPRGGMAPQDRRLAARPRSWQGGRARNGALAAAGSGGRVRLRPAAALPGCARRRGVSAPGSARAPSSRFRAAAAGHGRPQAPGRADPSRLRPPSPGVRPARAATAPARTRIRRCSRRRAS